MSIVFVDPPSPPGFVAFRHSSGGFGECCKTSRLKFPTLDVFHGASLLLDNGIAASVVDSALLDHSPEQCVEAVLKKRPTAVVFRTASGSCPLDRSVAGLLRRRFSGPIVFHGPHAAVEAEAILDGPGVDAVFAGEGPAPFLEMARQGGFDGVPGFWHKRAGAVVKNPPREQDLEALPIPRWDLVDYRRYSYVTSQTSWGCPFRCGYCPYPVTQGARWRTRSAASVVAEFLALRERYGLRFVLLRDPEFSLEKGRTADLCEELIRVGTPILWGCETRLDTLDEDIIALMARAGCVRVAFGVDSVNEATLRRMRRGGLDQDGIRERVSLLKRLGLLTYAMYIIGLPGETEASTRRLVDFALELDTNAASFSMATPFPGTELEKMGRSSKAIEAEDPVHLTGCVPSMRNEALTLSEVEKLYLWAKERWNGRKPGKSRLPASALSSRP